MLFLVFFVVCSCNIIHCRNSGRSASEFFLAPAKMATTVHGHQELLTPQQMMQVASYEHAQPETDPTVLRVAAQVREREVS